MLINTKFDRQDRVWIICTFFEDKRRVCRHCAGTGYVYSHLGPIGCSKCGGFGSRLERVMLPIEVRDAIVAGVFTASGEKENSIRYLLTGHSCSYLEEDLFASEAEALARAKQQQILIDQAEALGHRMAQSENRNSFRCAKCHQLLEAITGIGCGAD